MGDERAETYIRLLAEAELRRASRELRRLDATAENVWADPGMAPFQTSESTTWKVGRAGQILIAAGVLDWDYLARVGSDLHAAVMVRSRLLMNWDRRRGRLHRTLFELAERPPPARCATQALRAEPFGAVLRGTGDRAPWTLHLLALVRAETEAVITVAMRMHWPPDGSSADLELTGAGPQHMPYDKLWAVDDQGTRYTVRFEGGQGETATWLGIARLSPAPPPDARRLDLIGDGTRLIQLPLGVLASPGQPPAAERIALDPGERLLTLEAERILATGDTSGPVEGPTPAEIITVLTEAGAITPGSPVPGQLAALIQRLDPAGHGLTVPPAPDLPAPWASVLAARRAPRQTETPAAFVPLTCIFPEVDGVSFALAGLSTTTGETHLHVISSGLPPPTLRYQFRWTPGFSWWLTDNAGNWHVATAAGEPCPFGDGLQAFWLRLTPPLTTIPDPASITLTGPATQARATVGRHP